MDIRSYFVSTSTSSTSVSRQSSGSSEDNSDVESVGSTTFKKACTTFPLPKEKQSKPRKYHKEWERDFCWLEYDEDCDGAFCKICKKSGKSFMRTGAWISTPFTD